ncbi:hypothetical protein F4802DRAFT_234116 [Xylaria palmicola]|nr:hypothetical protein F4802DRAFT_234116 [Xylaria palmicola]
MSGLVLPARSVPRDAPRMSLGLGQDPYRRLIRTIGSVKRGRPLLRPRYGYHEVRTEYTEAHHARLGCRTTHRRMVSQPHTYNIGPVMAGGDLSQTTCQAQRTCRTVLYVQHLHLPYSAFCILHSAARPPWTRRRFVIRNGKRRRLLISSCLVAPRRLSSYHSSCPILEYQISPRQGPAQHRVVRAIGCIPKRAGISWSRGLFGTGISLPACLIPSLGRGRFISFYAW